MFLFQFLQKLCVWVDVVGYKQATIESFVQVDIHQTFLEDRLIIGYFIVVSKFLGEFLSKEPQSLTIKFASYGL